MWELSANIEDGNVTLYSGENRIGILGGKRVEMMKDWIKNNDPYTIILEGIDSENKKAIAYLAFYRDKRAKMSYREVFSVSSSSEPNSLYENRLRITQALRLRLSIRRKRPLSSRLLPPERKPLSLPGKKQPKPHRNQLRRLNRLQRQR